MLSLFATTWIWYTWESLEKTHTVSSRAAFPNFMQEQMLRTHKILRIQKKGNGLHDSRLINVNWAWCVPGAQDSLEKSIREGSTYFFLCNPAHSCPPPQKKTINNKNWGLVPGNNISNPCFRASLPNTVLWWLTRQVLSIVIPVGWELSDAYGKQNTCHL